MTLGHRAFGLRLVSDFPLTGLPPVPEDGGPEVTVRLASPELIRTRWRGALPGTAWETVLSDGCVYRGERDASDACRFTYADRAVFWLSGDAREILCAPADRHDPAWMRVLLDAVLTAAAVRGGRDALHAAAVEAPGGVLAFLGDSGAGKTSLAAELVRRGMPLVCDDVLVLDRRGGQVVAHPGPPLINLPAGSPCPPAEIGRVLARLAGEAWVAVDRFCTGPRPLAAVCLLERRAGAATEAAALPATPLHLLPHALGRGSSPGRQARRFALLGDLVSSVPVVALRAGLEPGPGALADLVAREVAGARPLAVAR